MPELKQALTEIAADMAERTDRGEVATYIPQLGKVDPKKFGIAAVTNDGRVLMAGDADEPFSIQSISKVFTLTLALGNVGDALWQRVGREPSGNPFNSIVQLEHENGIPRNPFINAGAIVISDILLPAISRARRSARSCASSSSWPTTRPSSSTARSRLRNALPVFGIWRLPTT